MDDPFPGESEPVGQAVTGWTKSTDHDRRAGVPVVLTEFKAVMFTCNSYAFADIAENSTKVKCMFDEGE